MKQVIKYVLSVMVVIGLGLFFSGPSKYLKILWAKQYIGGEIVDGKQYAKVLKSREEAFPEDIKEVEKAWGEPIPEYLIYVGGYTVYNWAFIYHDSNDPPHIFRGEFRDREKLYKGRFEYYQPDGRSLPQKPLEDFHMAGASSGKVHFSAVNPKDDFIYFELRPIDGEVIYSGSPEAEAYRQSRR